MRHIILLASLLLSAFAFATESVRAMQFFSFQNGVRLPDSVSDAAYYTTPDPTGKELRVTTNVAAAVYSMVSGLLERHSWMTEINGELGGDGNDYFSWNGSYYYNLEDFYNACKTEDLYFYTLYPPLSTAYHSPYERVVSTYRITPPKIMRIVRDELIAMAENEGRYFHDDYGAFYHYPCQISSVNLLHSDDCFFPSWGWTNQVVYSLFPIYRWSCALPTLFSAPNDEVWKDRDYGVNATNIAYNYVYEPMRWFAEWEDTHRAEFVNNYETNIFEVIKPYIYGTRSDLSLYDAIISPFQPEDFTNDTLRLNYKALGVLERCVESVNLSYDINSAINYSLIGYDITHSHRYSSRLPDTVVTNGLSWKDDGYNLRFYITVGALEGDWERYELWESQTNSVTSWGIPRFYSAGELQDYGAHISAGLDENVRIDYSSMYAAVRQGYSTVNLGNTRLYPDGGNIIIAIDEPWTHWISGTISKVMCFAGITRKVRVFTTTTDSPATPKCYFQNPAKAAYDSGIVAATGVQGLFARHLWLNPDFYEGTDGWYATGLGTGVVAVAETRSSPVRFHTSYYSLTNGWAGSLQQLNRDVGSILPYHTTPRDALIPIPQGILDTWEDEVVKGGEIEVSWTPAYTTLNMEILDNDDIKVVGELEDGSTTEFIVRPNESILIGGVSGSKSIDEPEDAVRIPLRQPFAAEGDLSPLLYIYWKPNSIRDPYIW